MGRYKKLLLNILLLSGSILFFLIVAEGVTRLVMPNSVRLRLMYKPDDRLGYRLAPNYEMEYITSDFDSHTKINSEGLRDYEHQKNKDSSTIRILVLGDSFTFGVGVSLEDSYPKVLEAMLNQNPAKGDPKKYEVINAGVEGYGTEQEYLYLEELANRYSPDLVIVGLYSNDIDDVIKGIPSAKGRTWLKRRIFFLSYLRGLQISLGIMLKDPRAGIFQVYQDQYEPQFEKALQKTNEYLIKIKDLSYSIGAKTFIVIIPSCFEIEKRSEWEKRGFGRLYNDEFFNKNMSKFSDTFTEFGETREIPTLPLLPVFKDSKVRPLYYTKDFHWTREGHSLAAESIYNFMRDKGFIH
ncbi:MAG TPA: GDSL-type esterase/lipase family protein [Candidatus Brocadiales bacterium]|nr:GDSL-type esterase/lipase family protein [Candidatus Brocadiales bacterium]